MDDIPRIIDALGGTPLILERFVASIPDAALHRRRGEGFWTVAEHVAHLAEVQPMLAERIRRFLEEDAPAFVPHIPSQNESDAAAPRPDMSSATAAFGKERLAQVALPKRAAPGDWAKPATHPEYTRYTLHILARHILMHDHWHMYRMEALWLTRDHYLTVLAG